MLPNGHPASVVLLTPGGPRVKFDGREFNPIVIGPWFPVLYIAAQARRGDRLAAELLNEFAHPIPDADNKPYWPMTSEELATVDPAPKTDRVGEIEADLRAEELGRAAAELETRRPHSCDGHAERAE